MQGSLTLVARESRFGSWPAGPGFVSVKVEVKVTAEVNGATAARAGRAIRFRCRVAAGWVDGRWVPGYPLEVSAFMDAANRPYFGRSAASMNHHAVGRVAIPVRPWTRGPDPRSG